MQLDSFPGLNLVDNPYEVGMDGFVVAENVDITRKGALVRRPGRSKVYTGVIQAAWGDGTDFLFLEGNALKQLNSDYSATVLASDLLTATDLFVCRDPLARLYWSTGLNTGVVERGVNRDWGVPQPTAPIVSPLATGDLPAGRYLAAVAFMRGEVEGPLSPTALFEDLEGISVAVAAPVEVSRVNLYLTTPNGETLYLAASVEPGNVLTYAKDCKELGLVAENQFLENMPVGGQIIYFSGRLFVILDDFVIFTEPYSELIDIRQNFLGFGERVQAIGAVSDGLYVATDIRTYFLQGTDPTTMDPDEKLPYGAIPGTMTEVDGRLIGEGQNTMALLWATPRGFCAGLPGGTVVNLTERQVNSLTGTKGTAVFRQQGGQNHFITVLQD